MTEESVSTAYIQRFFTKNRQDPYDACKWVRRTVVHDGKETPVIFPEEWYQESVDALAMLFQGEEHDLHQLIDRIVNVITKVGYERGYFLTEVEADVFHAELKYLLLTQRITFAKDIWQNVGRIDELPELPESKEEITQPISDLFMRAIEADGEWRAQEEPKKEGKARHVWQDIVRDVWKYGDTTIYFQTIADDLSVLKAHNTDTIVPKADIRITKYVKKDGSIDDVALEHTVTIAYTALDILTQYLPVETPECLDALRYYRPISLGLSDVSSVLLALGLAYDSDEGREVVRSLYAFTNGHALSASMRYAQLLGSFVGYDRHTMAVGRILRAQRDAIVAHQSHDLSLAAKKVWSHVVKTYKETGVRNIRIGGLHADLFMQQAIASNNLHITPVQSLTQRVTLSSGGSVTIVTEAATQALKSLGYSKDEAATIANYMHDFTDLEKAPLLKEEHTSVFYTSSRYAEPMFFEMLSVIVPFVGAGVALKLPLPKETTPRDIEKMLVTAWQLGIPKMSLMRNESTARFVADSQVEETPKEPVDKESTEELQEPIKKIAKKVTQLTSLPKIRTSKTFAFCIDGTQCYLTVSETENGTPLELLVNIQHNHAQLVSVLNAWAQSANVGLQHGVALSTYIKLALDTEFAPAGKTDDDEIPLAHSILDYIARRLALHYLTNDQREAIGINVPVIEVHKDQVRLIG